MPNKSGALAQVPRPQPPRLGWSGERAASVLVAAPAAIAQAVWSVRLARAVVHAGAAAVGHGARWFTVCRFLVVLDGISGGEATAGIDPAVPLVFDGRYGQGVAAVGARGRHGEVPAGARRGGFLPDRARLLEFPQQAQR